MSDAYDDEDEFMVDDEVYDIEYSSDEEESGDYQFENIYYGAKSIKVEDWRGAIEKFNEVIQSESEKVNGDSNVTNRFASFISGIKGMISFWKRLNL